MVDEHLEMLSDKIRNGTPVVFLDAIAAIEYQKLLRQQRKENSLKSRLKRWSSQYLKGQK